MVLSRIRARLQARRDRDGDPQEALEVLHLRQLDLLQRVRVEATRALTVRQQLELTIDRLTASAEKRATAAREAVGVESDDHVRALLRQQQGARGRIEELSPILARLRAQEAILLAAVGQLAERVDGFAARKQTLLARLHAAEAAEQLAHDERQLRDQTAAIEYAVGASREAAALVAARDRRASRDR